MSESELIRINACEICGSKDIESVFANNTYELSRCKGCGLVFVANRPIEERIKELYSPISGYQIKYQNNDAACEEFLVHCRRNFDIFKKYVHSGAVLDVGCSIGGFLSLCKGYNGIGLEINDTTRQIAKERFNLEVYKENLDEFALFHPEKVFDAVTLWDVLEHLANPNHTLQIVHKILKKDGYLFVQTPNIDGLFARVSYRLRNLLKEWYHPEPPYHLFQYGVKTISRILNNNGFEVVDCLLFHASMGRKFKLSRKIITSPRSLLYVILLLPTEFLARLVGSGDMLTVVAKKELTIPLEPWEIP